jgi:cephalosporin hydroxylase
MTDDHPEFLHARNQRIARQGAHRELAASADSFLRQSLVAQYSYNFDWLGLPIIQYPQDMIALQEIIWSTRPEVVIETGIARGGSLVFYASMLRLLGSGRKVIGIDNDLRAHNRRRLLEHPLADDLELVDGSSPDLAVVERVEQLVAGRRAMLVLDSNHTHAHVLAELLAYTPMVSPGCYCVVFDTIIEQMPAGHYSDRPWDKGDNPWTAVDAFLADHQEWRLDQSMDDKLLISAARHGYLVKA